MRIDHEPKLDFDDVLIRPKRSEAPSRAAIILEREHRFLNSKAKWKGIPIVASNMDTVGTMAMAQALGPTMMTCVHKYYTAARLIDFFNRKTHQSSAFFTLGIKDDEFAKLRSVKAEADVRFVCVDAANGYTKFFVERVKRIREEFPSLTIMAGNVATPDMVQELLISGAADIVKIGIGSGSVCTTRIKAGVGYPQLSAIIECADAAHGLRGHVCADGGCRTPGDVVKAFAAGADFVMLGSMLAGHDECEGEWVRGGGQAGGPEVLRHVQPHGAGQVRRWPERLPGLRRQRGHRAAQGSGDGDDPGDHRRHPKCLCLRRRCPAERPVQVYDLHPLSSNPQHDL